MTRSRAALRLRTHVVVPRWKARMRGGPIDVSAAPGWYDAGEPGRLRRWDGVQWTAHETAAPDVPPPTAAYPAQPMAAAHPASAAPSAAAYRAQPLAAAGPAATDPSLPPMGWYPTPNGPVRWWDGARWSGMRVKDGRPGIDWATSEQPRAAIAFAAVFFGLGLTQLALALAASTVGFVAIPMMLLAVLWLCIGVQASAVQRMPRPAGAPLTDDLALRPLPGEVEGSPVAGAPVPGWYTVAPATTRWWTGERWSQYIGTRYGVRPSFHGAKSYRLVLTVGRVMLAIGALGLLAGIVLTSIGASADDGSLLTAIGVFSIIAAVLVAGMGILFLALSPRQKRILVPPENPPT